jgi:protein-tyrosine kinase
MDKLAKALSKARAERDTGMPSTPPRGRATPHIAPADLTQIIAGNVVNINEITLDNNRIVAHRVRSKEADTFRILRTQVLQAMTQHGMRTLGITSPNYGDGKTTISINLALSIALDLNQTVLLVDLDLRKPNVLEYLGLAMPLGITDYFLNDTPIADCMVRPSFDRLAVLPAGRVMEHSSEVLGSPKIAALAEELRTRYPDRIIIYDLPPILAQDDPLVFLPNVDGVLLVVNEGVTRTSDLKASLRALTHAQVIGTVLNHSDVKSTSRREKNRRAMPLPKHIS